MRKTIIGAAIATLAFAAPFAAGAQVIQGTQDGAQRGVDEGTDAAGPIGGIVGGAIGAGVGAATGAVGTATGIVGGLFGAEDRPRFHDYVEERHSPSYDYDGNLQVGTVLPRHGVNYYAVPRDFHVDHRYRYAVVNNQTVIVDPRSGRIVQIID